MGKALVVSGLRQLAYETYADPALKPDEVRIQTLYSGISAGTEMTQYRGTNPTMNKRWDETTRLYVQSDAPSCDNCGAITVRNGNCYLCHNCGNSMGCS